MKITEISVKRPSAVLMIVIFIIGLGIYGYFSLGADLLPGANTPIISVMVTDSGSGAGEIEDNVLKPLENSVSSIGGIDSLRSKALNGFGYLVITFKMNINSDKAFTDVQQAVAISKLPESSAKPLIQKFDMNSMPIMRISITGKSSNQQLIDQAHKLKTSMEKLVGIGSISISGETKKNVFIDIDKNSLNNYGFNINMIVNKIMGENLKIPAGSVKQEFRNQNVNVDGEFKNINEIKNLNLYKIGNKSIVLKDISDVKLKFAQPENKLRLNEIKSIGVFIQKQTDANIIEVTDSVREQLKTFKKDLPKNIKIDVVEDQSDFIKKTLDEVKINLLEGILTTTLVMLIFLRMLRPSLIVLISIPTSLLATFFMMSMLGYTLNILSMLALSSCIGILVDDSIVILENIQRHLKMGKSAKIAAIEGRSEIGMAAIAITLCDIVVFAPVALMTDMIGQFFREFGITVVCATLFSLLVSFTLTPMLASKLLGEENYHQEKKAKIKNKKKKLPSFNFILKFYEKILIWSLKHRVTIILITIAAFIASALTIPLKIVKTEFLPITDQSSFTIKVSLSAGSNIEKTDKKVMQIEKHLKKINEVKKFYSIIGSGKVFHEASIIVILKDKSLRKKSQTKIAKEFRSWGRSIKDVNITATEASIVGRTSEDGLKPVYVNLSGPDKNKLKNYGKDLEHIVKSVSGTTDVENTSKASDKDISIKIDRNKAVANGFTVAEISSILRTSINGTNAGIYKVNGNEHDIVVRNNPNQLNDKESIENLIMSNSTGNKVQLKNIAKIIYEESSQEISRFNKKLLVAISANIEKRTLGDITNDIKTKINKLNLPNDYKVEFGGEQKNMVSSFDSLIKVLILSIFLVYMILVILYESFFTPLIRMLSLPCGLIGSIIGLIITNNALNLVSLIGIVMMDGLVSKNGTLLIDYTNTLMKQGINLKEALIKAGTTRLKPIMMTSITMIVGMLPTALALGEGSEIKSGIGVVLIGGMITSTFFTPILLPVVYTIMNDIFKKIKAPR